MWVFGQGGVWKLCRGAWAKGCVGVDMSVLGQVGMRVLGHIDVDVWASGCVGAWMLGYVDVCM